MFCQKCGKEIPENAAFCPGCGDRIAQPAQPVQPVAQPVQPGVQSSENKGPVKCGPFYFPRNPAAICSYYLGFASLLFCFFTGIPALICGICGLVHAHRYPEGRGVGHSVFGIVMGSVTIVIGLIWLIFRWYCYSI